LKEDGRLDDSVKVGRWREYHEVGSGGRLKKEWKFGKDKFDTTEPELIQERDQQSKVIYQAKNPTSQHTSGTIPPINSDDDEDSEDISMALLVRHSLFSFTSIRLNIPANVLPLRSAHLDTSQTPPDFSV
jgi:hypothetical protein